MSRKMLPLVRYFLGKIVYIFVKITNFVIQKIIMKIKDFVIQNINRDENVVQAVKAPKI